MSRRVEQKLADRVMPGQAVKQRRRRRVAWIAAGVAVLLAGIGVGIWQVYQSRRPPAYAMPKHVTSSGGTNAGIMAADEGGAIPVDVYVDFLCQRCRQFSAESTGTLNQLLADKKIKLIWHPVSLLDARTNPPGYSMRAANAVACAGNIDMNKMKALGEMLFASQPAEGSAGLSDDQIIDIAGHVGLIQPSFAACERDVRYRDWVGNVNAQATARGISETPTVYVNDKLVPLAGPDTLTQAVASGG